MQKRDLQLQQLTKAVARLREVLALDADDSGTVRDSAIQRFAFCVDLSWKTIKTTLTTEHGITCTSPKSCLREAHTVGIIAEDDATWLDLLHMRNLSSHTYNETLAEDIYQKLPDALKKFETLLMQLA